MQVSIFLLPVSTHVIPTIAFIFVFVIYIWDCDKFVLSFLPPKPVAFARRQQTACPFTNDMQVKRSHKDPRVINAFFSAVYIFCLHLFHWTDKLKSFKWKTLLHGKLKRQFGGICVSGCLTFYWYSFSLSLWFFLDLPREKNWELWNHEASLLDGAIELIGRCVHFNITAAKLKKNETKRPRPCWRLGGQMGIEQWFFFFVSGNQYNWWSCDRTLTIHLLDTKLWWHSDSI